MLALEPPGRGVNCNETVTEVVAVSVSARYTSLIPRSNVSRSLIMRRHATGPIVAGILLVSLAVVPGTALAQLGGSSELVGAPGGGVLPDSSTLTFSVGGTELVPGGRSTINIDLAGTAEVSSGHLILQFDPPVFVGTPSIGLEGGADNLVIGLTPLGAGIYRIDFGAPLASLDLQTGPFLRLGGIADAALMAGDLVSVQLSADATLAVGGSLRVLTSGAERVVGASTDALVLRVSSQKDLVAGELATIEIRTYNPKPISEGQVCFQFSTTFFADVSSVSVQAAVTDVSYSVDTTTAGIMVVQFSSPSAAINRLDGPLILVEMRLSPTLPIGAMTAVDVDIAQSFLLDAAGVPVSLTGRSGTFVLGD